MNSHAASDARRYPRWCHEEKRYPDGRRNRFRSRVLLQHPGHGVLHFVSDRAYDLGGIYLPRGTVTFGLFWEHRPYNLYAWMAPRPVRAARPLLQHLRPGIAGRAPLRMARPVGGHPVRPPRRTPHPSTDTKSPATAPPTLRAAIDAAVHRVLAEHRTVARYLQALLPALRHHAKTA